MICMVYFTPFAIYYMCIVQLFLMLMTHMSTILAPMPGIGLKCQPLDSKSLSTEQGSSGDGGSTPTCPGQHQAT